MTPAEIQQWAYLIQAAEPLGIAVFNAVSQLWTAHKATVAEEFAADVAALDVVIAGAKERLARIEAEEAAEAKGAV